jgi:hypothetical protein
MSGRVRSGDVRGGGKAKHYIDDPSDHHVDATGNRRQEEAAPPDRADE